MADWVWVESAGTALDEEPRIKSARFGDGYEQTAPDGINAEGQSWSVQFDGVENSIADEMIAFLRTYGRVGFNYVPLWETQTIRVICRKWRRTHGPDFGASGISATFERSYAP